MKEKKLYKFCAKWCGHCRRVGDHGAEVIDIDEGDNILFAESLDIKALPTFVQTDWTGHSRFLEMPETDEEIDQWIKEGEEDD